MSILLEALRKSEKGQRQVEAPTIHSEQHIATASERVKKGPLAALLLAAMLLIAWVIWRQYEPSTTGYQPPVALPAKQDGAITPPASSIIPATDDTARVTGKPSRTPVENFEQAATDSGKTTSVKPKATRPLTRPTKVRSAKTKPKPQVADTGVSRAKTAPSEKPDRNKQPDHMRPQPISYWELPDAIRADIPVMKFSVLVYAGEPANRFVLINGQRLVEGDSIQQGLVVEEIRRDGVVFSYRLYQFLVDR